MNKSQVIIAVILIVLFTTTSFYLALFDRVDAIRNESEPVEKKDGTFKQYNKDNKLKTVVNYKQGVKHGVSYLYYDDGKTILLEMPYINGDRHGVSKKYYENGRIYAETSYENDKLHGKRKLYYTSGQLKAEINYADGYAGVGTREYLIDGTEKDPINITYEKDGNLLWLSTSSPCKKAIFYIGKLEDDRFFNPTSSDIRALMDKSRVFYIDTNVYTPSYLQYQDIICSCESSQGNPIILKRRIILD